MSLHDKEIREPLSGFWKKHRDGSISLKNMMGRWFARGVAPEGGAWYDESIWRNVARGNGMRSENLMNPQPTDVGWGFLAELL